NKKWWQQAVTTMQEWYNCVYSKRTMSRKILVSFTPPTISQRNPHKRYSFLPTLQQPIQS
ncbi:MAG TPA: hypothetical protein VEP90_28585, partial [Methylomirabilota bacterium]|nr:hypothetical protein [Methylomirabilota bacterium]